MIFSKYIKLDKIKSFITISSLSLFIDFNYFLNNSIDYIIELKMNNVGLNNTKENIFKYIFSNKFIITYIVYYLTGQIAYSTALGLRYMFVLSALFMMVQLLLAYVLIYQSSKLKIK